MPEVFDKFFEDHNTSVQEQYELVRLDPSYQVFFDDKRVDVPANFDELLQLFEDLEQNGATKLKKFLKGCKHKYVAAMKGPVTLPGLSPMELINLNIIRSAAHLNITSSFSSYVNRQFSSPYIRKILEFPILFLGSSPDKIPAMYSMLNYADLKLGTWYPMGGMNKIIAGMENVVRSYGVDIKTSSPVDSLNVKSNHIESVHVNDTTAYPDMVVAGADYHHVESKLLPKAFKQYSDSYWDKREMAPSAILMFLGVKGELKGLQHHNLFFDASFDDHMNSIYNNVSWPSNPLFYISNPSKTDSSVAPTGHENLFVLIPTAPGKIENNLDVQEHYLKLVIQRLKKQTKLDISDRIVFKKFFMPSNFMKTYNAFKGNAYGLANTLRQTHFLKPRMKHKTIKNLYYTGQLTVPGPGVPPSIISGEIVAKLINGN